MNTSEHESQRSQVYVNEQPTSLSYALLLLSNVRLFRTVKGLNCGVIRLKITQRKKKSVVILADVQVMLVAVEGEKGIDRNKSRLCYFQMLCSWFREECDELCWTYQLTALGCSAPRLGLCSSEWKAELGWKRCLGLGMLGIM